MAIYFPVVMLSPFSLTGFWTDNLFSLGIVIISLLWSFKRKIEKKTIRIALRVTTIISSIFVFGIIGLHVIDPFSWTVMRTKMARWSSPKPPIIEFEYFEPTGSRGCGCGTYWKTKTLICFPFIEYETDTKQCAHDDWGHYIKTGRWE